MVTKNKRLKIWEKELIYGGDDNKTLYLERLHIFTTPIFRILLHTFHRGDEDRCLHDHPWSFLSIILKDGYFEETPRGHTRFENAILTKLIWYPPFSVLFRPATWRHRVILQGGTRPVTLVFATKKVRDWGFWTKAGEWIKWDQYLNLKKGDPSLCE